MTDRLASGWRTTSAETLLGPSYTRAFGWDRPRCECPRWLYLGESDAFPHVVPGLLSAGWDKARGPGMVLCPACGVTWWKSWAAGLEAASLVLMLAVPVPWVASEFVVDRALRVAAESGRAFSKLRETSPTHSWDVEREALHIQAWSTSYWLNSPVERSLDLLRPFAFPDLEAPDVPWSGPVGGTGAFLPDSRDNALELVIRYVEYDLWAWDSGQLKRRAYRTLSRLDLSGEDRRRIGRAVAVAMLSGPRLEIRDLLLLARRLRLVEATDYVDEFCGVTPGQERWVAALREAVA